MVDFGNGFDKVIREASSVLGKPIDKGKYEIIDRGMSHQPKNLPPRMVGIYTFYHEGKFMKMGKAGPNSNSRFLSQHYSPKSAQSTLAASILLDNRMQGKGY
ncbi:hypothetical protein [Proteiniborus ethanoligenes]|uniref:hypothetical protein n=1 Tax=Proteiniborus ethanoligenes TaxID=415015 RepID=UPI000B826E3C|nr:hypothetical protein [Proteiniborus ethanoligenes]